ncbi:MAG: hypothetical protein JWN04_5089 [Myxococcaceae bacterium]|nr:hypothetical protein [Myxococcaceae bacterium]
MSIKKYKAHVKPNGGASVEVRIEAKSQHDAKALLEGQYGKGSVVGSPHEVH